MKVSRTIFFIVFCLSTGYALWANPFTGKKGTPAPVQTEKPNEFITVQQQKLHTQLGEYIYEWSKTHSVQAFWTIMALAFFYGFVHALGPGHRKTIIFSFYLSKSAPVWEPLLTGTLLAALHGITTIVLLYVFRNVKGAVSGSTSAAALYLEAGSFLLLIVLALFSILHLLAHIFPQQLHFFHFGCNCGIPTYNGSCGHHDENHEKAPAEDHHTDHHGHELQSGTGSADTDVKASKIQWGAFMLSGLYPCPASLLVMVLVLSLDAVGLGIAAIISMSLGMAVPVTLAAYLAWAGRARLFQRLGSTGRYVQTVTLVLGITAYTAILVFSVWAIRPFIGSLITQGIK